jgi:CzcA family heavy metal efflux pump
MSLPRFSVANPILVNLIMFAFVGLGIFALFTLPQEQVPDVSFPWAFVFVADPGLSPEEVEKTIIIPLEEELQNLDDLDTMTSVSRNGGGFVWLKFDTMPDTEFKLRIQDVRAEVNKVQLPESAEEAEVTQFSTQDFAPLISVVILGDMSEHEFKRVADDLKDDILDVPKVSKVQISGVREREVWVEVDPAQLERYGLTLDAVAAAIRSKHLNMSGGDLETGRMDFRVRTVGEARKIEELHNVIVQAGSSGGHVRVGDVATVSDTFEDEIMRSRFNGKPAVTLTVSKKKDGHSISIIDDIKALCDEFTETRLPPGAQIDYTNDSSIYINDILSTLKSNAWMGMILVAITLFLFLGWRQAAFAVIGIPVAVAMTFVFLRFTGNTVNGSTLFALVLVLGMLVDDAVVVIENSFRYMEQKMARRAAAVTGAREVMMPVLTSAATTVAAFLPLMLLPGVIGDFMRVIPIVVSLALAASLFESFAILPSHIAEFGRGGRKGRGAPLVSFSKVRRTYRKLLAKTIRRRYWVMAATTLVILASLPVAFALGVDMFADEEIPLVFVHVTMPDGTRLDATDVTLQRLEDLVRRAVPDTEIKYVRSEAGLVETEAEWIIKPSVGELVVEFNERKLRQLDVETNIQRMREATQSVPGIKSLEFKRVSSGPPTGAPVEVKVRGDHLDELAEVVGVVKAELRGMEGVEDIKDNFMLGVPELQVVVDEERAAMFGLDVAQVARTVHAAFNGMVATEFLDGEDDIDVVVKLNEEGRKEREDLANLRVVTPTGARVLLKDVARIQEVPGFTAIRHDDTNRAITVTANVDKSKITGIEASRQLQEAWPSIEARYPGYDLKFGGQFKEFQEAFNNLVLLFGIGVALMMVIMSAQFNSVTQPLIIFMAVLFAFWGAVLGLFVIGSPFSINNLFGLVALAGVAVNNSIVLISFINGLRERGASRIRAVLKAGHLRVRPILLTSVTTVVGLLPMAIGLGGYSEVWGPLATVMVFGLTASSVLSLFLIPSLYFMTGDIKRLMLRRRRRDETTVTARWKERAARRKELAEIDHSAS